MEIRGQTFQKKSHNTNFRNKNNKKTMTAVQLNLTVICAHIHLNLNKIKSKKKIRFFDEIKPFHYFILVEHRMSRSFQLTYLNIKIVNSLDYT